MAKKKNLIGELGKMIGCGIIAGLAGTAAITVSQMIEMKITGRKPSDAPADAVKKTLHIKAENAEHKPAFTQEVHWTYGTLWGIVRGMIGATGLKGAAASTLHLGAIWGTAMVIEPKLDLAPPVSEWEPKTLAIDGVHHAVYALVAGWVYDCITKEK